MKMICCGSKIKENCHVLVNQFHENIHSKSPSYRKIKSVFRDLKWSFNASWGLKVLRHTDVLSGLLVMHTWWVYYRYTTLCCDADSSPEELFAPATIAFLHCFLSLFQCDFKRSHENPSFASGNYFAIVLNCCRVASLIATCVYVLKWVSLPYCIRYWWNKVICLSVRINETNSWYFIFLNASWDKRNVNWYMYYRGVSDTL